METNQIKTDRIYQILKRKRKSDLDYIATFHQILTTHIQTYARTYVYIYIHTHTYLY